MMTISEDTVVDQLMRDHKETIRVFLDHRMLCVGCPVGRFHTVRQACEEHDVCVESFLQEIGLAVRAAAEDRSEREEMEQDASAA